MDDFCHCFSPAISPHQNFDKGLRKAEGTIHTILRGSSGAIWRGGKVSEQEFRGPHQNHLTSINAAIDRRDDGDVCIAHEFPTFSGPKSGGAS